MNKDILTEFDPKNKLEPDYSHYIILGVIAGIIIGLLMGMVIICTKDIRAAPNKSSNVYTMKTQHVGFL
jgi:uncharacterized membrane protein